MIEELESEAIEQKLVKTRNKDRRKRLKHVILSCLVHKGHPIHYTRSNQTGFYKPAVDLLVELGLVENHIAEPDPDGKVPSYFDQYEKILERFKGIPKPKAKRTTIIVRKKVGIKKVTLKRSDIKNQKKLRSLEKFMGDYNDLLNDYKIIHPHIEEKMPMRYHRVMNGGNFRAKQGWRLYSRHPAFLAKNAKDLALGGKPRDFIEVEFEIGGKKTITKTVRCDYRSLHTNILYLHQKGESYRRDWIMEYDAGGGQIESDWVSSSDPYRMFHDQDEFHIPDDKRRGLRKMAAMMVLGSGTPLQTFRKFIEDQHAKKIREFDEELIGDYEYELYREFESIKADLGDNWEDEMKLTLKEFKDHHKDVLDLYKLSARLPLTLQYIDSFLLTNVFRRLMELKKPCWGWHDEILVPYFSKTKKEAKEELEAICAEEFMKLVGSKPLAELDKFLKVK